MKPRSLNRQFECDDGIFNVKWERDGRDPIQCEWKLTPCTESGKYWCVECGMVVCLRHRKKHADSKQHRDRVVMWVDKGVIIPRTSHQRLED